MHSELEPPLGEDLESFVRSTSVPVAAFDADGRYTFVNEAGAVVSRMSIEEHLGRTIDEIAPDVASFTRGAIAKVLESGQTQTITIEHGEATGFVASYFRFWSRQAAAARVGMMCVPTRVLGDLPTPLWRARLGFESLLANTASRLLTTQFDRLDAALVETLDEICASQLYPCALVVRLDKHGGAAITHESQGPTRSMDGQTRPLIDALVPFLGAIVSEGQHASSYIPLRELPKPLRKEGEELAKRLGVEGVAAFSFSFDGTPAGVVGFLVPDYDTSTDYLSRRLRMLSDLIASALLRSEKERALATSLESASQQKQVIANERDYLREEIEREYGATSIVGSSPAMRRVLELARTVADTSATVLVRGESGVGKELVARAIHKASSRRDTPIVKVNCASIPRELFESEFFGHTRGAFTGALRDRVGRFELANGGTLFLDEIGEIPLAEQAKLLRVIQEGEFERVGEDRTRRVDVRIIAATNRRLERDVEEGRFRRDLYFRLNVFPIEVPPLRERLEDVVPLAEHFIATYSARVARRGLVLSSSDRENLRSYAWPGNVRELANVIERSVILAKENRFEVLIPSTRPTPSSFPKSPNAAPEAEHRPERPGTLASLRQLEAEMIEEALRISAGKISGKDGAAERLGLHPSTLRDRIKALGLRH